MSRNMNPITVCCAAVLMLGLAACGSDNGGDMADMPSPVPVDLTRVSADAARAAGMAEIAAGGSATIGEIAFACAPGGEACSVTVALAADGTATAMATGGTVTAADSAAYTTRKAVATDAAVTKEMAMAAEAAQANDDGPGGRDAATDHTIVIAHDGTGSTVTVAVDGAPADAPEFAQAAALPDGRTMHVLTNPANEKGDVVEEVMIVATDIDAPTSTLFADVPGQALNARDRDPAVDADGDGNAANDFTALTVGTTEAVRELVEAAAFAPGAGSSTTLTFDSDDTATTDMDEAYETAGSYNGAPGTYRCHAGAPCTISVSADGAITNIGTGWVFTPNAGAMSLVADTDYLHYGFWLKRTTASDGAVTYDEVQTFAGSEAQASGSVAAVEGTASYEGGAVGVYAIRHRYNETSGELVDATSGHFLAQARLTAYFAGPDVTENQQNSVTGTIDQFELQHGEANDWAVKLDGNIAAATGTASGTTSDAAEGSEAPDGSFSATFHGPAAADTSPHSVVGEFNANFEQGRVAGAFGARKPRE
ncbi:MAG: hypothetical protein OXI22_02555 [Defluviicoccus sp.]|nr:hypothetical protein [Defluviicoccus sp.]MDE0382744.1 hypothetical protein [Defluviicoccus sp.]